MSTSNTSTARSTGPQFEHHQCIEVACTACGEALGDDTILHFDSIAKALAEINRCQWQVTEETVRCCACIETTAGDLDTPILVVSRCTYCWPPLFSATPVPQTCQCAHHGARITHRLRVPFISRTHPAFTTHACVTLTCSECDQRVSGSDDYDPHFSSPEHALQRAADEYDWLVSDVLVCCDRCSTSRACAALGHQFPEQPDHILAGGTEIRCCANCDATARNPADDPGPTDRSAPPTDTTDRTTIK